jgi:hypothetical protein
LFVVPDSPPACAQLATNQAVMNFVAKYSRILPLPTFLFVTGALMYLTAFIYTGFLICKFSEKGNEVSRARVLLQPQMET